MVNQHLAVIIARGGSKRIPQKNIIDFMGKPLLAWTVEAALASSVFTRVLLSTDDEQIAQTGRQFGAEAPFLRTENADDQAPSSHATLSALNQAQAHFNESYDTVTQLMPNCPLRDAQDIRRAFEQFQQSHSNFQLSCFPFGWMNPWWAFTKSEARHERYLFPEALKMRSQDLSPLYCPTGAIWMARTDAFMQSQTFYGDPLTWFELDWKSAVDIDDYGDLEMAQAAYLIKRNTPIKSAP